MVSELKGLAEDAKARADTVLLTKKAEKTATVVKDAEAESEKATKEEKECDAALKMVTKDAEKARQMLQAVSIRHITSEHEFFSPFVMNLIFCIMSLRIRGYGRSST